MKKLILSSLLVLVSQSAIAAEQGTCADVYEILKNQKSVGEIVGKTAAEGGVIGSLISIGGAGTVVLTAGSIAAYPVLLPALGVAFVGAGVWVASDAIHDGRLDHSIGLIEGAYQSNPRFERSVKRINQSLIAEGRSTEDASQIANIIRQKNESGSFCPIKKHRRNGTYVYTTFSVSEIEAEVTKELMSQ